jgi:hypothetical protein
MPEAVRITLWFDPNPKAKPAQAATGVETESSVDQTNEPPLVFQTVARLNLVKAAQDSGGSSLLNNGTEQAPTPNSGAIRQ